jgi:hypothetical protein
MKKKIFFLAGLPRAGNTILSCILNQNPKIAVTPNSFLFSLIRKIISIKEEPVYKNAPNLKDLNNVVKNVFLNIPKFKHSFKNLKQIKINNIQYDDSVVGHNLHMIKTKDISFTQRDIKKVLGDKLIKKYSDVQIRIIQ